LTWILIGAQPSVIVQDPSHPRRDSRELRLVSVRLRELASAQAERSVQAREASAAAIARSLILRTKFVAGRRIDVARKEGPPADHLLFSPDFSPQDRVELLAVALQCAKRIAATSLVAFQLRDSEGALRTEAHCGLSPAFLRFFDGLSGPEYLREDGQVFLPDIASDSLLAETGSAAVLKDAGIVTIACTPIVHEASVVIGWMSAYYREPTTGFAANLRGQQVLAARVSHWLQVETVER
jgi:hypothetical protein